MRKLGCACSGGRGRVLRGAVVGLGGRRGRHWRRGDILAADRVESQGRTVLGIRFPAQRRSGALRCGGCVNGRMRGRGRAA
jgi:hypothetical protein